MMVLVNKSSVFNACFSTIPIGYWKMIVFIVTLFNRFATNSTFSFGLVKYLTLLFFVKKTL